MAVFSRHDSMLDWAKERAVDAFGDIALESEPFFVDTFTSYYSASMGTQLSKKIWAFEKLIDPGSLAEIKIRTNRWEEEAAAQNNFDEERPLNLDPGYLELGKLVLASTKDHGHRIYLQQGIFAEVTLLFTQKHWEPLPWSYADYQSEIVRQFLDKCRQFLQNKFFITKQKKRDSQTGDFQTE